MDVDEPVPVEGTSLTPSTSDNFTDAQHKKRDEDVIKHVSAIFREHQELSVSDCMVLLYWIVKCSEGKLRDAFADVDNATRLILDNPKLECALKKAWRTKDYKEIQKSGEPRVPSLASS